MPFTVQTNYDKQLTIYYVTGDPSFYEAMAAFKNFYEGNPTKNALWDFRKANLASISSKQIEGLLDYIKQYAEKRPGGKTAIVVSKDLEYGMSRMIQTFTEIKKIPFRIEIFKTNEDAISWLDEE